MHCPGGQESDIHAQPDGSCKNAEFRGADIRSPVTACAWLPQTGLTAIGSKITPTSANFGDLYAYAERSKAAYGTESDIRSKYPVTVRVASPDNSDVQYFLGQDDANRMQRISVRGTVDNKNWSEDLDITARDDHKIDVPVHAGFDLDANAIYTDVKPFLKKDRLKSPGTALAFIRPISSGSVQSIRKVWRWRIRARLQ